MIVISLLTVQSENAHLWYNSFRYANTEDPLEWRATANSAKQAYKCSEERTFFQDISKSYGRRDTILIPDIRADHKAYRLLVTKLYLKSIVDKIQRGIPNIFEAWDSM